VSSDYCVGCGARLPRDLAMRSISHTIKPGEAVLCSSCGAKESIDPAWAEGRRIGLLRTEAALKVKRRAT